MRDPNNVSSTNIRIAIIAVSHEQGVRTGHLTRTVKPSCRLGALYIWVALALVPGMFSGFAADITWTGAVSSDWTNAANWSPQQVPAANDHVIIGSGPVSMPADASFAVINWTGGSITGAITVASTAVLIVSGDNRPALNAPLTTYGQSTALACWVSCKETNRFFMTSLTHT